MKHILSLLLLFFSLSFVYAQNYGNEWINYSQKYYAFKIVNEGLYRIDYNGLISNNIPIVGVPSSEMQIFGREKEVPLFMVDGGDNSFDPGDYFLFRAEGNDGWLDSTIVIEPDKLANPTYSMINDTISYFFTWNPGNTGLRFTLDNDSNFGSYTPSNFVLKDVESRFNQFYTVGFKIEFAIGSTYAAGEGYGYNELVSTTGNYYDLPLTTPNPYTGGDAPLSKIHFRSTSNSSANANSQLNHHLRVSLGASNLVLFDSVFSDYVQVRPTKTFATSLLGNGNTNFRYEIVADLGADIDRQVLTYYQLRYPRIPNSNNSSTDEFRVVNAGNQTKTYINLGGLTASNPIVLAYGTSLTAVTPNNVSGNFPFLLPNTNNGSDQHVFVFDQATAQQINSFRAVGNNGTFVDYLTNVIDSALILVYPSSQAAAAANYINYRKSLAGGSHNVVAAEITELYDQFGGGISKHVGAIRRFSKFIHDNSSLKPQGLFLVGKGISAEASRTNQSSYALNLVPTLGYPASDISITAGLNGTQYNPLIPTGRIATRTNAELQTYLDKIIEYEAAQNPNASNFAETKEWQKQILHFTGGSNASQQTQFQSFMNNMASIIEDSLFAGNVTTYNKTTSDPLDPVVVAGVTDRISAGVSIMNFFGHAAVSNNGFEINIDDPSNWENEGKYPVVIGNSCYNGDIFGTPLSTSERFVLLENEGAIAFLSSVYVGYSLYLSVYSTELYRQISNKNIGKSLGYQIQQTIRELQTTYNGIFYESTYQQMALHGDPLLKINYNTAPEIHLTQQQLSFSPTNINLNVDSIEVSLDIKNLGLSITDSVVVEVKRDFPGTNIDSVYTYILPELQYLTHFTKKYPLQPSISAGINQFTITVDIPSVYPEQFEEVTNNKVTANFIINIDGINPIWPYNYAVVPYDTVTVKASTINPIADIKTYLFEIDTTDTYNSPQYRRMSVTGLGGVKEVRFDQWLNSSGASFPLICADSGVYFWRVAVDSSVLNWSEFSFQYIPGKRGWGQDHFFQFKNNDFTSVQYDRQNRLRVFPATELHNVTVDVFESSSSYFSLFNAWYIDGGLQDYATCGANPGIYVGVIDSTTLQGWKTHCPGGSPNNNDVSMSFGNLNDNCGCRNRYEYYFIFDQTDPAQLAACRNMLENEIPNGNYVIVYTPFATLYDQWDALEPELYTTFQNIGAPQINNTQENKPFALFYKKGAPALTEVKLWPQDTVSTPGFPPKLTLTADVYKPDYIGFETTPFIGPAAEWKTVYWRRDSLESPSTDSVRFYIEGYDLNQNLLTTIDTVFTPNDSILNLNALLDATTYPLMRLGMFYYDLVSNTPAQVDRLHVLYSPIPEAAIDGSLGYYLTPLNDSIFEGQSMSFAIDVKNISDYPMDSLLISYWVEDVDHIKRPIAYPRQAPLLDGQTIRDTVTFSTVDLAGVNSFWMEVNPYINGSLTITDQVEQYHFNNLLQIPFDVIGDDEHPILDVTFNGKHILNGDIIDPESEILITLKDDNPYLVMNDISDTTHFGIYLTDPSGNQIRIPFINGAGQTIMQWIPADAQYKKFKILYPKVFDKDGKYTLIVQGSDRSGNVSGDFEYRVNFEIVRESSITYLMNYPNPFSTSTRFVFTLTGSEPPEDVIIQIMTVTGKVVREITEDELGPISIGRNITEFAWNGTDEFGDPLANGVYLYRVKAKINGEDIKHRESGADGFFKEEFGKMYLFR